MAMQKKVSENLETKKLIQEMERDCSQKKKTLTARIVEQNKHSV